MNFYSVRDLRTHPKEIWKKLSETREIIITNNGKPTALMIEVDEENVEDILNSLRQAMTMRALNKIRMQAKEAGLDKMSIEEIEEEIKAARKERKR
ncbi:MAG: type II toxin-antitoxin system Phd/YefM family antitoxin [Caloramator sp.]|nr:type II toxin-antitoxin system Phd/YefM family antitoxin [Caloramator sp.]